MAANAPQSPAARSCKPAPVNLGCEVVRNARGTRKSFAVNGSDVRYARFLGHLRIVTFVPADLQLIGGAPALRRALLNGALAQAEPRYYRELARYMQTLAQKNAVLRGNATFDEELIDVYNRTLVEAASFLVPARARFVRELDAAAAGEHARFSSGSESLRIEYACDVACDALDSSADVADAFERRLRQSLDLERIRKTSVAGPHRDDVVLTLDGRSLSTYGSQGQQRTAVLALKLAEYATVRDRGGEAPLLLLDDVLSELDDERAAAFVAGLGGYEQVFLTAVTLPHALRSGARVYGVERARVTPGVLRPLNQALEAWKPARSGRIDDPVAALAAAWPEIVGPGIASNSQPVRIDRGTLSIVTTSGAWGQQLTFLTERLLAAIRERTPQTIVERLRFRVGAISATRRAIPRRPDALAQSHEPPRAVPDSAVEALASFLGVT